MSILTNNSNGTLILSLFSPFRYEYFRDVILVTAAGLQSWREEEVGLPEVEVSKSTCDDFGKELLECVSGMSLHEICVSVDVH